MTRNGTSRPYSGTKREAKAAETRSRLLAAATALLRQPSGGALSLESVAVAAGVTRLTVYNQFGSRRGLLEETFDNLAAAGAMATLTEAMALADPHEALAGLVRVFCDFWSSDDALAGLFATAAIDTELAESLALRNERRRMALGVIVRRRGGDEAKQKDVVDLLFALTSFPMFQMLRTGERGADAICALLQPLCSRVLEGESGEGPGAAL